MIVERVEERKDMLGSASLKWAKGVQHMPELYARVTARTFISIKPPIGSKYGYWAVPFNLPVR